MLYNFPNYQTLANTNSNITRMAIVNLTIMLHTSAKNVFKIMYFKVLIKLSNYTRWHFREG